MIVSPEVNIQSCPACERIAKCYGPILGRPGVIDLASDGLLWGCGTCGLFFRSPYPTEAELDRQYAKVDTKLWAEEATRPDFDLAERKLAELCADGHVLDVGCYSGRFLGKLPPTFAKYGIEKSVHGRRESEEKGIRILGARIQDIPPAEAQFDVITAFDVLEHIRNPADFMRQVARLLPGGGVFVGSTGNCDHWAWRMSRQDHWYYFPDHVSFLSPRWFQWFCGFEEGLEVLEVVRFSRCAGGRGMRLRQAVRFLRYHGSQAFHRAFRTASAGSFAGGAGSAERATRAPATNLLRDHFMVFLRKS